MTYELFYNPKTAQHFKQAQIVEIDSRIAKLEQLIGYSSGDNVDSLVSSSMQPCDDLFLFFKGKMANPFHFLIKPNNLSSTSIVALVSKLEKQMTVLSQPRHLDMISRRVKLVNTELDKLNELKNGKGEAGNNSNYGNNNQKNGEANAVPDATDDKVLFVG